MAEREGFEPPEPFGSTVFKTAAIDHSATSPVAPNSGHRGPSAISALQRLTLLSFLRDSVALNLGWPSLIGSVLRHSLLASALALLLLAGCASTPDPVRTFSRATTPLPAATAVEPVPAINRVDTAALIAGDSEHQKVGNAYTVAGQRFVPQRDDDYDAVGIASWYGPTFHGRPTANGEVFDQNAMTAAHTTLPIPSIVEVTNLENGRQVVVRVNDRGPFVDDRLIDLSRAAADQLGYRSNGLARVRVRYLGPAYPAAGAPDPGYQLADIGGPDTVPALEDVARDAPFTPAWQPPTGEGLTVQAGAFSDLTNANSFASRISGAGDVWVQAAEIGGRTLYRVFLGHWTDRSSADAARSRLANYGVRDARIIALN
jgi:rare lipoprotein A